VKLEKMREIANKRTLGEWQVMAPKPNDFHTVVDITGLEICASTHIPDEIPNANFIALAANTYDKLLAVAEAARDETMFWNEDLCNRTEYDQMVAARDKLKTALKELDGEK